MPALQLYISDFFTSLSVASNINKKKSDSFITSVYLKQLRSKINISARKLDDKATNWYSPDIRSFALSKVIKTH